MAEFSIELRRSKKRRALDLGMDLVDSFIIDRREMGIWVTVAHETEVVHNIDRLPPTTWTDP